jgi:hypothetical protein|tara:strand:- start:1303 stop:1644 length:342 start_codon:yes stop_codon:yes gene_type:complete
MPDVTINSVNYSLERHKIEEIESAANHDLMSGAFKKDVFGVKSRFECGSDHFTAAQLATLKTAFELGTSFTFVDLDSSSYTVLFEDNRLAAETNRNIPWSNRRYIMDFALREV